MADDVNPAQNEVPGQQPVLEPTAPAEGAAEVTGGADAPAVGQDQGGRRGGHGGRGRGDRGPGRGRGRGGPEGEGSDTEENVVKVYRCATVVKGGRRFSFAALVVVGDRRGRVGIGYGKANEVPDAIKKSTAHAHKQMVTVKLKGDTIPHDVVGEYDGGRVLLRPATTGTGLIAGGAVRAVLEAAGVKNVLTKSMGSSNHIAVVHATLNGLRQLRLKEEISTLRSSTSNV